MKDISIYDIIYDSCAEVKNKEEKEIGSCVCSVYVRMLGKEGAYHFIKGISQNTALETKAYMIC